MFKYGLVGNIVTYGGILTLFGYVAYELDNVRNLSNQIPEELARELFDPKYASNISLDQKEDMRKVSAKLYMQDYQRKKHESREPKDSTQVIEQQPTRGNPTDEQVI